MTMEERGVYITLLSHHWLEDGLPNNEEELKVLCQNPNNWERIWGKVGQCFYGKNGKLYNKRLLKEKQKQKEWRKKSQQGGIKSGLSRRKPVEPILKGGSVLVEPKGNSSSSSSSSVFKEDIYKRTRHEVIAYLNDKTGKNFYPNSESSIKFINGRLSDSKSPTTKEDLLRVIDIKVSQWLDDPNHNKYLRPETLFNRTKFEGYRNETPLIVEKESYLDKHKKSLELRRD